MPVDWTRTLTRPLALKSGERLRTLHDATELFTGRVQNIRRDAALEHAMALLLQAAERGRKTDRRAATAQVALVLHRNRILELSSPTAVQPHPRGP